MEILQIIKQDEILSGNEKTMGLLNMADYSDSRIIEAYEEMKSDIKEFKMEFGNEFEKNISGVYYKWELALFAKWRAATVKNGRQVILRDLELKSDSGKVKNVVFMFPFLSKLLSIYEYKLAFAKEMDSREVLGDEGYEEKIREKRNKMRESIRRMKTEDPDDTDEFSIANIIKSGREQDEKAEKEERKTEFCKNYKPEKGEINVAELPL